MHAHPCCLLHLSSIAPLRSLLQRSLALFFCLGSFFVAQPLRANDAKLQATCEATYQRWRQGIMEKNFPVWQDVTATYRQRTVRNRLLSERRAFPQALFELPAAPPSLKGLKLLKLQSKGPTLTAVYYGKIDFEVGGEPTPNLLVLSFVQENALWKYDQAEFISLAALPEVRRDLDAGKLDFISEDPRFRPTGILPPLPPIVPLAPCIAKVYVFCPGREVDVTVNGVSPHHFSDAKEAEIVIGGAVQGKNSMQFRIQPLPSSNGKEALAIRVYLLSQNEGMKPIKACEYQVLEGEKISLQGSREFVVDAATIRALQARSINTIK